MKKISSRQLTIVYCIYSFSIKFLVLPQLLSQSAGRDAWISALIGTILELAVLFIALTVLTKNQNSDIYSSLRRTTRWFGAKVVMTGMLVIFLIQIFILTSQAFSLLNDNMFERIPVYFFSIPMLLLGVFFCFMPVRALFRSGEIFFIFIVIGIALSVFPAIGQINPGEVLPILGNGIGSILGGFYLNLIYFESAFLLLMFSGNVKIEKHFRKNFMAMAAVLGVFFVFFVFMFYSLFGPLSPHKNLAISNLTLYSSFITQNGRLDWVLVTIWLLLLLLRFGITFYCAFSCLQYLTNVKHRAGYLSISLAVFVFCISTFVLSSQRIINNFIGTIPWLIVILYVAIPVFIYINSFLTRSQRPVKGCPVQKYNKEMKDEMEGHNHV